VEFKVILRELHLPGHSAGSDFVRLGPVGEVFVVGPDDYREGRSTE
jgi:hypothetical protein